MAARVEAWFEALAAAGLAEIEAEAEVAWQEPPKFPAARTIRAVPLAPGAIPLVVAMTGFEEVEWPAVALGAGDPAAVLEVVPDCACDACDSGSQDALDELDEYVICVVTGTYRKLWRGKREITVYSEDEMGWSGFHRRRMNLRRFVGRRFGASPAAATDDYFTTNRQCRPRWLHALRSAIAQKSGRRRNNRNKVKKILARPRGWHQLHGSSWLSGNGQQ